MYSRQNDRNRDLRIPRNYSGNVIFASQTAEDTIKQHVAKELPVRKKYTDAAEKPRAYVVEQDASADESEQIRESDEREIEFVAPTDDESVKESQETKATSLRSPIGALGSEELLLIALALIIFQGGKEPEIALLLLALLFIN